MTAPPSVTMLWGEDAFLLREVALELLGDVRAVEVDAADWLPPRPEWGRRRPVGP